MGMRDDYQTAIANSPQAKQVRRVLEPIGGLSDADRVADYLRQCGITGHREEPCDCPISNLITKECGIKNVVVTGNYAATSDEGWVETGYYELPRVIRMFIQRFDFGSYPDLVAE